ncbi:hypothetical protein [Selenomonas ruminantium]|uniref:hypothetical protein n=1 Tax=Selenomonas ruminantium TaxID=971 RepID=UPI0015A5CBF8|nr:hypothetical protein [Selenomonas ruminantium]
MDIARLNALSCRNCPHSASGLLLCRGNPPPSNGAATGISRAGYFLADDLPLNIVYSRH